MFTLLLCSSCLPLTNITFLTSSMFAFTGEVIKHGDAKCVQSEGMPMYRNPCEKGQLYINFQVRDEHLRDGILWITFSPRPPKWIQFLELLF